jgi:hypothetical protein
MVLSLTGHHPALSIGGNARRQGLKTTFALLYPRSPGLSPRSLFGYSIVDSLITAYDRKLRTTSPIGSIKTPATTSAAATYNAALAWSKIA